MHSGRVGPGGTPFPLVVGGPAWRETRGGRPPRHLTAGDILLFPHGAAHTLHDGSGESPAPARERATLNMTISENAGTGDRLDMLCGRFVLTPQHERLLRDYLPPRLVVRAPDRGAGTERPATGAQLEGLVTRMRTESALESLGGRAMLNALSTAMFAWTLLVGHESDDAPPGLLALPAHPPLAPALAAMFQEPARALTLPEVARLCH